MMSQCLVRGCRNASECTDSAVTFHPFPAEREAAERWASLCGVSGQECSQLLKDLELGGIAGRYQLCSLHFEQKAYETTPEDKTTGGKLRPGAEPTLLLSPGPTSGSDAQVNASLPATRSPQRQTPPPSSSCSSCTCAQSLPPTSKATQGPGCGQSSNVQDSAAEIRPQVSHCPAGATVLSPQPGVSQIVLNFRDQGQTLKLDNVSTESAPQCQGGCHCQQRVVKQVVLIFLDHPCESTAPTSSTSSQESPPTLTSGTQTEEQDGDSGSSRQVHPERPVPQPSPLSCQGAVQGSAQTTTCMEVSEVQGSTEAMESDAKMSEVTVGPGEQQTPQPCQEPMETETSRQADLNSVPPTSDRLQTIPESPDKGLDHRCSVEPTPDSQAQQLPNDQAPSSKCEQRPDNPPECPHSQRQTCRPFCIGPSINQYVGDLLEQYNVPPPPCVSSVRRRVQQIVLNFVGEESSSVTPEVPAPCTSCDLSPPLVTSRQHQETQTCGEFLQRSPQRDQDKPKSPQSHPSGPQRPPQSLPRGPPRPPQSYSCPPALTAHTTLFQVEESSRRPPVTRVAQPPATGHSLENKVTFEDIAVYFCQAEWELLGDSEKGLYKAVMSDNYLSLTTLGLLQEKPALLVRIENEEENLWVSDGPGRRIQHQEEDLGFLDPEMEGVRILVKDSDTSPRSGRESAESSSHLGALMRLVNEIPGFLLGSSVTDGSSSPACSTEEHGSSRAFLEVKTEERSPACSPASAHVPLPSETPEIPASPGLHRSMEQCNVKIMAKAEKTEVAVSQSSRYSTPVSPSCIKSDPGTGTEGRLQIKQEESPAACSPALHPAHLRDVPPVKLGITHHARNPLYSPGSRDHLIPDHARRPSSGGGAALSRSTGASPRNPRVSPMSPNHGTNCTGLEDLKIKIKQEDSGSDRDLAESPLYGRRIYQSPVSASTALQADREHWRLAASPLRSPADPPLGSSPLHRLVNCLKDFTGGRPRPYLGTLSSPRWGADMSRLCADVSGRGNPIPAPQPNPFTVAVTNGAAQLRGAETKTPDSQNPRAGREGSHMSSAPLSSLGRCLEKLHPRGVTHSSEDPRRAELGVKRTHSDDLSGRPGVFGAKRPALDMSSSSRVVSSCSPGHRDLWRPPEELPRAPTEDQSIGSSHLISVMNCVRKIPGCRPSPSIQVTPTADPGRTCTQGVLTEMKVVKVKQEKDDSPPVETSRQWIAPPHSPEVKSGAAATNVHLTGLMRLMEEIPCVESSNPSRAMYSIAVGHSLARRMDRANYLSCNDDSSFQAELNDSTIASVDSVYSDDTSWSSENVDPSYSAIGGLQRVVSEFAELGSVSPLVAVGAPPVSSVQDAPGLKKPKEAACASTSRLNESTRRSPRDAVGVAASACSAENGEAAIAAIRGLQKVVHGFVEQECVSPITAVRNSTPNSALRDCPGRKTCQEEEAPSPHLQASSPAPVSHLLCDTGKWLSAPDSSYSALSGLQKVVNGFSEMSCVSPFSAVSTPVSEVAMEVSIQRRSDVQAQDFASPTLSGQKTVINGVPEAGSLSPLTVASTVSSESDAGPATRSRRSDEDDISQRPSAERLRVAAITVPSRIDSEHCHSSSGSQKTSSSHCIDLTQEEEPASSRNRTNMADKERKQKNQEGPSLGRAPELPSTWPEHPVGARAPGSSRVPCNQLIDLTKEEETPSKPKVSSSEVARRPSHTGISLNSPLAELHRPSINLPKTPSGRIDKPLDPGASGANRGAVPAVNEHLSGLEKLLKGVPTFTPAGRGSGQAWSGSWWFKSTSSHET
ncbi:uncharacterized protein RB166_006538 isoform 1-T6 [Leptodactylus fuscus]